MTSSPSVLMPYLMPKRPLRPGRFRIAPLHAAGQLVAVIGDLVVLLGIGNQHVLGQLEVVVAGAAVDDRAAAGADEPILAAAEIDVRKYGIGEHDIVAAAGVDVLDVVLAFAASDVDAIRLIATSQGLEILELDIAAMQLSPPAV